MDKEPKLFAGYFPVIHDGYIKAFERHPDATIGIFNEEIIQDSKIGYTRKDIRALSPEIAQMAIKGLGRNVIILGRTALELVLNNEPIIMPDDDITRKIAANYPDAEIIKESVFLRWDRDNSTETSMVEPDREITLSEDSVIIKTLSEEAKQSSNWWRHIGAVVFDNNEDLIISSHNSSVPTEYTSYIESDPRITAKKGESIERSIDIHAEARLIANACKHGLSLEGTTIYVSTFPCPNCAKLIAESGIKTCCFVEGYAMLDGQSILKNYDIEIIKINAKLEAENPNGLKPYPEK